MKSIYRSVVPCILALSAVCAFAQPTPSAVEQLNLLRDSVRQAHLNKDAASYLANSQKLSDFLNGSPQSMLQLTSAQAFAGAQDDALRSFSQFVNMGQSSEETLSAEQFKQLRDSPRYSAMHTEMLANDSSKLRATQAFALEDAELNPEDIDYDPNNQLFYITSVLKKVILAVTITGQTRVFATSPDAWPMMALKVDSKRNLLWATEVALDGFVQAPSTDWGRSAVLIYDLKTGKLLHRLEGPHQAALGDMTLTSKGDAIVSDGEKGGVYRVSREPLTIERIDGGDFVSPQTPVMSSDETRILVPDYVRGIGVLDPKSKQVSWIPMEGAHALNGIDGLYLSGSTLIATQNGTSPERVIAFNVDAKISRVLSETVIERSTPTLGDPTHGVIVGGSFYYIANSGWDTLDEHGNRKSGTKATPSLIMKVRLPVS